MKKLVFIIIITLNFKLSGQTTLNSFGLMKEINWFIDTVKVQGNDFTNQFKVYVLYAYKDNKDDFCFTLGYIMNSYDSRDILPTYFFMVGNEYVLVKFAKNIDINLLKDIELRKIDRYNIIKIVQKLYPSDLGSFTYHPAGLVYCSKGNNTYKKYFENADEIPLDKSIFGNFPSDAIIKLSEY